VSESLGKPFRTLNQTNIYQSQGAREREEIDQLARAAKGARERGTEQREGHRSNSQPRRRDRSKPARVVMMRELAAVEIMPAAKGGAAAAVLPNPEARADAHKTTLLALAQAYDSLGINERSVKSMPFDDLALSMQSPAVLQAATALLDRLETRLVISHSAPPVENIDHLLKHLASSSPPEEDEHEGSSS